MEIVATKDRIEEITHVIEERNRKLQEGVLQATRTVQGHASNVTEIVMSMQFQDISRQKLEKVIQKIHSLQAQVTEWSRPPRG